MHLLVNELYECKVLFQNKINLRYCASGWFYYRNIRVIRSYKRQNSIRAFSLKKFLREDYQCPWRHLFTHVQLENFRTHATEDFICRIVLTLILRRSRTGTVWFYTSTSNKRAARPKLYTESLTRDLKRMYSRFTLVRIYINL